MGVATITANQGSALYTINLVEQIAEAERMIAWIDQYLTEISSWIVDANIKKAADQLDLENKSGLMNSAITALSAGMEASLPEAELTLLWNAVSAATKAFNQAIEAVRTDEATIIYLNLQTASNLKRKARLEAAIAVKTRTSVYCSDYSPTLSGTVGTIEIDGDSAKLLIMPSGKTGLGKLKPVAAESAAAAAYNHTVMPGWQKWKPTYRVGTLSAKDTENNKCTVTLDGVTSKMQNLSINQATVLTNVPIEYMSCKADAFRNGDRVVVEFAGQNWAAPKVIGFAASPRKCPNFVKLHINSIVTSADFTSLCTARIAELSREKEWVDYCKDTFIPEVDALLSAWIGECMVELFGMCWVRYTADDYDSDYRPYKNWVESKMGANEDLGYNSYMAEVNLMISRWTYARTYFQAMLTYAVGDLTGGDPDLEVTAAPIDDFAMWIDSKQQDEFLDAATIDRFNQGKLSDAERAVFLWDVHERYQLIDSPEYYIKLYIPGFFEWRWRCKGVLDKEQRFFLVSTGYAYEFAGVPGGQIETLSIGISLDDNRSMFEYPSLVRYNVAWWPVSTKDVPISTSVAVRIKGRLHAIPTEFGATVTPYAYPDTLGSINIDETSPDTWMWPWYRDFIQNDRYPPRGFEDFAGRYPTHPLATGIDLLPAESLLDPTDDIGDLLTFVQNSVFTSYDYRQDEETFDHWTFMGLQRPYGDCEDFAITQADMLLNLGVPVDRLTLDSGVKEISYNPKQYDPGGNEIFKRVGHAWLLVDGVTAMNGELVPVADLRAEYPLDQATQISGLRWLLRDSDAEVTAIPAIYYDYSIPVVTLGGTVTRKDH